MARTIFPKKVPEAPPVPVSDGFRDCEYTLPMARKGRNRLFRSLLLWGYVLFSIGYCLLFTVAVMIPTVIAILPMLLYILIRATWKHVSYERQTAIRSGELLFAKVYGRHRRVILRFRASALLLATPYTEKYVYLSERYDYQKTYDLRTGSEPSQAYIAVFQQDGVPCAVIFDATRALVRAIAYYNKRVTVDDAHLRV